MRFRFGVTFVTLLAAMTVLFVWAGMASAATKDTLIQAADPTDPQNTNVPYVAWAGETVKVTKCLNFQGLAESDVPGGMSLDGTLNISGWTGTDAAGPNTPFFLQSNSQGLSVTGHWVRDRGLCFSGLITSEKPGLATLKLAVNDPLRKWFEDSKSNGGHGVLFEHDFLVIWLQSQAPVITEVPTPGDPAGDGTFKPVLQSDGSYAFEPGLVKVEVKGTFPLGQNWAGLGHATVTLPDDWAWLQDHFAIDASPLGSQSPGAAGSKYGFNRWDIHDDNLATEGHVASSFCTDGGVSATVDAVDNCNGSWGDGTFGPFSTIFSGTNGWTVGPFDPIRPESTLLSDGKVDSFDAPMPALRVDVALGAGSTAGTLSQVYKSDIYIRDASKPGGTAHNLYAPFYQAYVPAAWGSVDSGRTSGVYGASFGNNFASFLTQGMTVSSATATAAGADDSSLYSNSPLYTYWDAFPLAIGGGTNDCKDVLGNYFPTPTGNLAEAVYTDEHGEAYVQFNPDEGNVLTLGSNHRCDIYTGSLVGTASITATSVYPDQVPTWDGASKDSNTLTKTVDFVPSKTLACIKKDINEAYCVETIKDLAGNPIKGAKVEFSASGDSVIGDDATDEFKAQGYDTTGQGGASPQKVIGGFVDLITNKNGQAGIYVHSSENKCVDVTVENVGTRNGGSGITRDADINPSTGAACTFGAPANTGGPGSTPGSTPSSTPSSSPVVLASPVALSAPAPTVTPGAVTAKPVATAKSTLVSANVVKTRTGRYLSVRVKSTAKTAQLRITLVGKNGKSRIVLRTVATNRVVRVANLKLATTVKSVRVALA